MKNLTRHWSIFQTAIFHEMAEGAGNLVIKARAGSGKTTTIIEGLEYLPSSDVLLVAFNKSIATELQERIPKGMTASTLHSFGYKAILRAFGKCKLDNNKTKYIFESCTKNDSEAVKNLFAPISKLVSLAKGSLASSNEDLQVLCAQHNINFTSDNPECKENLEDAAFEIVAHILKTSVEVTHTIDFDDMIYIPAKLGLRVQQFQFVIVDETQDLNKAQLTLAIMACKKGGRIIAVGDDKQAIYGFRGADSNAIDYIIETLNAKVMPLSTTYRCAKSIVRLANEIVPDLEPADNAAEGQILHGNNSTVESEALAGDFILSRKNAPLISFAFKLIKNRKRCYIVGRKDIGENLINTVKKFKAKSIANYFEKISAYKERTVAKYESKEKKVPSGFEDEIECLYAIAENCETVPQIIANVETLFSDIDDKTAIALSSCHKAKGLERDRVFILDYTFGYGQGKSEEDNLWYVGVTRARHTLYIIQK